MPEALVFILRAVVLILLWGFVVAAVVAVRHDVFGTHRPQPAPAPAAARGARQQPAAAPSRGRAPSRATALVVTDGAQRGTRVALAAAPVTLGRAGDCTLVLTDDYASNHHARLTPRDNGWVLEDTGSTNGTFIAGRKLSAPTELRTGNSFTIGRTTLELQ